MIDKEDCCENCEEGIEPCCDEELANHIDEIFAEVDKEEQAEPEQPAPFIPEVKAKNKLADDLAKHLCCQNKFYIIYRAMEQMNEKELTKLRTDLRKYTKTGQLHPQLESKFRHKLSQLGNV